MTAQFDVTSGVGVGEFEPHRSVAPLRFGRGDAAGPRQRRTTGHGELIKVDGVHLGLHLPGFDGFADIHGNALHAAGNGRPDLVSLTDFSPYAKNSTQLPLVPQFSTNSLAVSRSEGNRCSANAN